MENTNTGIEKFTENPVIKKLNDKVISVIGNENIIGFQKAYIIADAIGELKTLLTDDYMKPIMALQGSRLGFKADKIYDKSVVKDCLIDAVLSGVQPFGNQFNIIANNMYITKEGFGYLLSKFPGLSYDITFELPRIKDESAAIVAIISWTLNGTPKEKKMDIPVKVNKFMGTDAVIGKATRKARAWLYNTIAGTEFGDGDVSDIHAEVVGSSKSEPAVNLEELLALYEMKEAVLNENEKIDAERILGKDKAGKPEPLSYGKLYKFLQGK